jgi:hypothetical protein
MDKPRSTVCGPRSAFAGVVARVESLRGRMSEAGRQACTAKSPQGERSRSVEGLFESLLSQSFGGGS